MKLLHYANFGSQASLGELYSGEWNVLPSLDQLHPIQFYRAVHKLLSSKLFELQAWMKQFCICWNMSNLFFCFVLFSEGGWKIVLNEFNDSLPTLKILSCPPNQSFDCSPKSEAILERLKIMFMANSKRQKWPCDHVYPIFATLCFQFLTKIK